jgi:hypothetical protein
MTDKQEQDTAGAIGAIGKDHIINLIESADAISMLIGIVGNYGGKLEYRRGKLRELAAILDIALTTS